MKEISFCVFDNSPVREVDSYYSGKHYMEDDPDYFGWERLEIEYDYVDDFLIGNEYYHFGFSPKISKKGRRRAILVGRHSDLWSSSDESQGYYFHLVRDTISLAQADSVLKSWRINKRN